MECEDYPENGASAVDVRCRGVKRRFSGTRVGLPQLPAPPALPARRPGLQSAAAAGGPTAPRPVQSAAAAAVADLPFMNEMDEITYWIYTKRAPCLMSYDESARRRAAARRHPVVNPGQPVSVHSSAPANNKKRKLSLLDDDSDSGKGHENIFFDSSQPALHQQTIISSEKTSDVNFNIKKSSVQEKAKKSQKKNNVTLHKKNKVVCSTPKNTTLRRSMRNSRKSLNESHELNTSYDLINVNLLNGSNTKMSPPTCRQVISAQEKPTDNVVSSDLKTDQNINSRLGIEHVKTKTNANGKFEDLSDVSGFTANYIRSTKIHSTKNGKKGKSNRSLLKESRQSLQKDPSKTVICVNKSINTGLHTNALNCSTDSSQNCLNLVTTDKNGPAKMSRATSVLKFMDSKQAKNSQVNNMDISTESSKLDLDASRQIQSNGTPRYPRRSRATVAARVEASNDWSPSKKVKRTTDPVESPSARVTRASSGRARAPVLVLSASSERVSSALTMNVAGPTPDTSKPQNKRESIIKGKRRKKSMNKSEQSAGRDSLRNKSGFAACFSDSDDDDKPLKPQKFFC